MKVEEAEIKEVKAYMTPDGKLYASKDEAVQAYSQSSGPYWAIGIGIGLVLLIVMAALIF